jgi:hypothetical protein
MSSRTRESAQARVFRAPFGLKRGVLGVLGYESMIEPKSSISIIGMPVSICRVVAIAIATTIAQRTQGLWLAITDIPTSGTERVPVVTKSRIRVSVERVWLVCFRSRGHWPRDHHARLRS